MLCKDEQITLNLWPRNCSRDVSFHPCGPHILIYPLKCSGGRCCLVPNEEILLSKWKKGLKHSTVVSIWHLEAEAEFHIVKISLFGRSPLLMWLEKEAGMRRWSSLVRHLGQSDQLLLNAHKEKVCRKTGLWQRVTIRVFFLSLWSPSGKVLT